MTHRHRGFTALLLASLSATTASGGTPVWIFLKDKGLATEDQLRRALLQTEQSLAADTRSRRAVRGSGPEVSVSDLPVASGYLDQINSLGGQIRVQSKWLNAVSIDATPDQLERISDLPFVDRVQPVIRVARPMATGDRPGGESDLPLESTNDFYGAASSQLTEINVPAVHALGYTGAGMRIGVLDSGFKRTHAAFNYPGHPLNVVAEHDFIEGDTFTGETADNQHQHGTWVLGTMGAYLPNVIVGGAYDAAYLLAKTEVVPTETQVEEDLWVAGLEYLEANGADVVTSSLGYIDWYTQSQLNGQTAVTTLAAAAAARRGLVITNAAGNEGNDSNPATSHLIAPADADLLITVGAVDASGMAAGFTSDGPTADGRVKPELMARGVAAATVRSGSDTGTTSVDGTSFATPLVASAITLVLQAHPDWTVEQLRYALFNTASRNGVFDPQYVNGYGIMNTLAAVQYSLDKYYSNPSNGSFATASNWTSTGTPLGVHNVFITPTNSLTVTGPTAATRIHRLTLGATGSSSTARLDLNGGSSFTIDEKLNVNIGGLLKVTSGNLSVTGITTNHGVIDVSSTAQFADVAGTGFLTVKPGAVVRARSVAQTQLAVGGTMTLTQNPAPVASRVNILNIAATSTPTGTLDLTDNAIVVDHQGVSPLATIAANVAYAYNTGAWNRAGITTSLGDGAHGIGYAEANSLVSVPSLFGSVDSTSLLIRYTIYGDADLTGNVEFADLLTLAQNYGATGTAYWYQGDFNYDRNVEFADLLALAQNYGAILLSDREQQALLWSGEAGFAADWTLAQSLVPEPALLGLMAGLAAFTGRRRHVS